MPTYTPQQYRAAWIKALRSGDYKQGRNYLCSDDHYCCLGVLCDLVAPDDWTGTGVIRYHQDNCSLPDEDIAIAVGMTNEIGGFDPNGLPVALHEWLRAKDKDGTVPLSLAGMNDAGYPFSDIADVIESAPAGLFTDSPIASECNA